MNAQATELYYLYLLRRAEVAQTARELEEALAEDHRENADMFDVNGAGFSGKKHPNKTMRRLEARLGEADKDLLCLLSALLEMGMELTFGEVFARPADFANAAAEVFALRQARFAGGMYLAADLTTPKAEHQLCRLRAAMAQMDALSES